MSKNVEYQTNFTHVHDVGQKLALAETSLDHIAVAVGTTVAIVRDGKICPCRFGSVRSFLRHCSNGLHCVSHQRSDVFQFTVSSEISSFSAGHEERLEERLYYIPTNFGQNQRAPLRLVGMIINAGMLGRRLVPASQEPKHVTS